MILDRSGVGFNNHGDYKIDCDDDQWSQIVQKDGNARYMRNKSWPHWEAWKEIYGKDRACGERGKGAEEAMNQMKATQQNTNVYAGDYYVNPEEFFDDEVMLDHVMPATADGSMLNEVTSAVKPVKKIHKKRKVDDKIDGYLDLMNRMHADTNDRLQTLSTRIGYEFDQSIKRAEVYKLLGVIPGLTMKHKFYTSAKLVKEPELLDLFMSMPEIDHPDFVVFLLETDGVLGG